jgi:formate dehydrogenase subunit gamma
MAGQHFFAGDPVVGQAATREDIAVGDLIIRHRLVSRLIHWMVALFFVACLFTGMPIWSPVFGWMASLFGGLAVCRWLHAWLGLAFTASIFVMFIHWVREMTFEKADRAYFRMSSDDQNIGKYNGGQKLFFFMVALLALLMVASGVVLWYPMSFVAPLREVSLVLHDSMYIVFAAAIIVHIYLGTAAEPGTFHSMTRGTVGKPWARLHHPRWYRDVTGEETGARRRP